MIRLPLSEPPVVLEAGYSPTGFAKIDRAKKNFWQLHYYLYSGRVRVSGEWQSFAPGYVCLTEPLALYEAERPGRSPHYYVHFKTSGRSSVSIPHLFKVTSDPGRLSSELSILVRHVHTHSARMRALFLNIHWKLVEQGAEKPKDHLPPGLESAMHYLEKFIHTPKPVAFLAERLGISQGNLSRLFKKHFGVSPVVWRRRRLAERARVLLSESHLSPGQIAEELGYRDLQHFNKSLRREFGLSPRALRSERES